MGTYQNTGALWEYYLIYLRKSRKDDPNETVEEVLSKHERELQELAMREFGGYISEENIYREIGSSESIEARPEMQRVLARIEDQNVKGVLVVDAPRLSRDFEDCGRLINDFRYTNTQVVTLRDTYDLTNKRDRRYFQDELLRGSDYQDYVKEVLRRGRENAVKRGCYIMQNPPYGYNKIKIGKDHTLEPNDNADIVHMIFEWYVNEDISWYAMAQRLEEMGIPAPKGGDKWHKEVLSRMVRNLHYIGKVVCNSRPTVTVIENGERRTRRLKAPEEECIIAEGKHPAIIEMELWDKAQEKAKNAPRLKGGEELVNVLAGLLRCSCCGYIMDRRSFPSGARYFCPKRSKQQCFKSVKCDRVLEALRITLEEAELPELKSKVDNDEGNARKTQERILAKLQKQMNEYREQEDHQYELLETKKYTQELFDRRNAQLRAKMEECEKQIYKAKAVMPKTVNYAEKVVALEAAIAALHNTDASTAEVNKILKAIIERIEFTGEPSRGRYGPREGEGIKLEVFLKL